MDEKEKDLENPEEIVDNDKIDLTDEDQVMDDDMLDEQDAEDEVDPESESEESEDFNDSEAEADSSPKIEDSEPSIAEDSSEKTIGEAIDEAETDNSDIFSPDPEVDAAVDDIVRSESDESIAEADAKLSALAESKSKKSFKDKIKGVFSAWWENKPVRYGTFVGLFILFSLITLLPTSRYTVLNLAGIRVSSSMVVVDSETGLPLKNIHVQLQNKSADTDNEGKVAFSGLKLGKSKLEITKIGYADQDKNIVLGWGSNPIGEQDLVATGEQFTFVLSDWKSNSKVTEAEAVSGENSAKADESGKIVLTVGQEDVENAEVKIIAKNYREETLSGDELTSEIIELKLVPSKKHVFVSNRNGEYDLYKIDVDANNEEILLAATGKEREIPSVVSHPTRDLVAYVSSRDGETNAEDFMLDGLFVINSVDGKVTKVTRSEQIQIIGWHGDRLVYLQIVEGTSAGSPQRSKLISYDEISGEKTELATANYFNDAELVGDVLYYSVSSYAVPQSQAKLYSVKVDGKENKKVVDKQVWSIFRTEYNTLLFSGEEQKWYLLESGKEVTEVPQVASPLARDYVNNPNNELTAWVDIRDGKGVLLSSTTTDFQEKQVTSMPGLSSVLYWVNDSTLVFRSISNSETADYIINLDGGEMQKITDITASRDTYF